ncbi:programmed cell death 6-interacting protein-like, partial [Atheta coriaria]|uniref:programmed cell death 6-interacting protein-like n=1 Tax=Dalotia coriaria TaxID=877792 RepID=UPI0031F3647D
MADFIAVPLKKPTDVDIVQPLKNLLQARYSTADQPLDYSDAINDLSKLRSNAIWRAFEKYESSLEIIYGYYDQLVALEGKIPAQEMQVPFKWKDAFDKGSIFGVRSSQTIASLSFERICVLFNIASLQSAVASTQALDNDEGLKLAAKLFQQAAGNYNHLKATVIQSIQQEPTSDLNPDTLGALAQLMLAQAQEIFVHKAILNNMKDAVVAKLAAHCEDLYGDCAKIFQKEPHKGLFDREWTSLILGKQAAYQGIAYLYQSLVCKANKAVGEEITWLTNAEEQFKLAQTKASKALFPELAHKVQRNLTEARKDNDFIYHERIPDIKSLAPIGKAALAKMIAPAYPMSQNFKDLFDELVPIAVHQAMAACDVRKSELVNVEISKSRDATQLLNSVLASLNLPAAIEITEGNTLPPSILEKAEAVRNAGGITALETLLNDLPDLLKRNTDILDETDRILNEEAQSDRQLREQFKERWTRTSSDKLTEMFRSNIAKYRQIINNAVNADKTVREKFETHRKFMEVLSKSPEAVEAAVPSGGQSNLANSSAVSTLRGLMEEVETIKAERDVIESELNSSSFDMKAEFMAALAKDGAINEPPMSVECLGKHFGPLQTQVRQSIERQGELVARIQSAHSQFVNERGSTTNNRDEVMSQLAAAHDAFRDLQNHLKEGTKFYNELTQLLVVTQNKISDFCFARKTEKEELLKDLTQESSRQTTPAPPARPEYHKDVPTGPPSSAPSQPTPQG